MEKERRSANASTALFITSMLIFGTIGIFRRSIGFSSGLTAMTRGFVGAVCILLFMLVTKKKPSLKAIKNNLPVLCLSGGFMGFNWIFLFEAYNYTSVATATLCYYMAPVFVMLVSPFLLKEKLTVKKIICIAVSLAGMVLVSGVLETGFAISEMKGVLFGLSAAVLYAGVMLFNKKLKDISSYDRTVTQLLAAAVVLFVYVLITEDFSAIEFTPVSVICLAAVCVIHTGLAYVMYFGSLSKMSVNTAAILSYIDPVSAVILSAVILNEGLTVYGIIGAVMILGAAVFSL